MESADQDPSGYIRPDPMSPFLNNFSIRDLEEFSGVKAHTIRIWEKRHGLLAPARSDTNIRRYGIDDLRNLLNVAYLNRHGHKISRIATMTVGERASKVKEIGEGSGDAASVLDELQMAMLKFDEAAFDRVSNNCVGRTGFRDLAERIYLPLLERIGILWQTSSICPAHEHFISNLVRRKIEAMTSALQTPTTSPEEGTFVIFLPEHEIHELGALYANYLLRSSGRRTIYLGQSVPLADIDQLMTVLQGPLTLLTFATTAPHKEGIHGFVKELVKADHGARVAYWIAGPQAAGGQEGQHSSAVTFFRGFQDLLPRLV